MPMSLKRGGGGGVKGNVGRWLSFRRCLVVRFVSFRCSFSLGKSHLRAGCIGMQQLTAKSAFGCPRQGHRPRRADTADRQTPPPISVYTYTSAKSSKLKQQQVVAYFFRLRDSTMVDEGIWGREGRGGKELEPNKYFAFLYYRMVPMLKKGRQTPLILEFA